MKNYSPGKTFIYKGKGFPGFDPTSPECTFVDFDGMFSAKVEYAGTTRIVELIDLEPKTEKRKNPIFSFFFKILSRDTKS